MSSISRLVSMASATFGPCLHQSKGESVINKASKRSIQVPSAQEATQVHITDFEKVMFLYFGKDSYVIPAGE